jgi:hypothetical protein
VRVTLSGAKERKMYKSRPLVSMAVMLTLAITAFTLGSASRVQAEPPSPCHYRFCEE